MKQRHETCPYCGLSTTPTNMIRHMQSHENGNWDKKQPKYRLDHEDLFCKFCGKGCKNKNSLLNHEIRCNENLDRIDCSYISGFNKNLDSLNRTAWNKGLTASTDDRVAKQVQSRKSNHPDRELDPIELELDDDGKLYLKYKAKIYNGKYQDNPCLLSFHEYCELVKEAGLKSSDLGYSGNKYDLARYNDEGPYEVGNCRFITHLENIRERKISNKMLETARKAQLKSLEQYRQNPEKRRMSIMEGLRKSKNTQFCHGEGTFWITNGVVNKRVHSDEEIADGFHRGFTVKHKN